MHGKDDHVFHPFLFAFVYLFGFFLPLFFLFEESPSVGDLFYRVFFFSFSMFCGIVMQLRNNNGSTQDMFSPRQELVKLD